MRRCRMLRRLHPCATTPGAHLPDDPLFPGMLGPLSDMSLTAVLRRMKQDVRVWDDSGTFRARLGRAPDQTVAMRIRLVVPGVPKGMPATATIVSPV